MKRVVNIYAFVFVFLLIYTFYGIIKLSEKGGPCNAGLALFTLVPALLFSSALLTFAVLLFLKNREKNLGNSFLICFVSLLIWSCCIFSSLSEDIFKTLIYLGAFELFILFSMFFIFKLRNYKVVSS
jgi:hypothetical protein